MPGVVLFLSSLHLPDNFHGYQWGVGLFLCALFSLKLKRLSDWVIAYTVFVTLYQVAWYLPKQDGSYGDPVTLGFVALFGLFSYALCICGAFSMRKKDLGPGIRWLTATNSLYVIWGYFGEWGRLKYGFGWAGFLDYAGMNGVMIALGILSFYPLTPIKSVGLVVSVLAIVLSRSSIPYGVLGVCLAARLFQERKAWVVWGFLPIFAGWIAERGRFFKPDGSGRFSAYGVFMSDWWSQGRILFGQGLCSFRELGHVIQSRHAFNLHEIWPWLHSDWLQCVFELGVIGFLLYACLFVQTAKKLYNDRLLFPIFIGLGAAGVLDFPIRYFPMAFLATLLTVKGMYS